MADRYRSFVQLAACADEGVDFRVVLRLTSSPLAIVAPHGGGIEAGTSEIADVVAGRDYSFYTLEGLRSSENAELHITSTNFDEPRFLRLLSQTQVVVAIHGRDVEEPVVFLGGLDHELAAQMRAALEEAGYSVSLRDDPAYQGLDPDNLCNRGQTGRGLQMEISRGLRRTLFAALSRQGRKVRTRQFASFVKAVRRGFLPELAGK